MATISRRRVIVEEHTTAVTQSVFGQDQIIREKYARHLEDDKHQEKSKESVVPESTKKMRSNLRKSIGKRLADEEDTKDVRSYKYRRGKRHEEPYTFRSGGEELSASSISAGTSLESESDENLGRKSTRFMEVTTDGDDNETEYEQEINDITDFDFAYQSLDPTKMWTLESSGRIVEKVIYEYARTLKHESYLHSFIINDVDKKVQSLFRKEELEEIFSFNSKIVPKIDKSTTDLMKKYSVTNLSSFRNTIFEPFLPTGTSYSNEKHFDLNYINHAYRAIHTLWEKNENSTLNPSSRLEGWYQHNIWSPIIDPVFRDLEIDLIRGEGSSMASSDRKNDDMDCEEDRKKVGRKGDGIFRLNGDRLEFGAIEAGKKWEGKSGRKYITDSLKLGKMLRDMFVQLAKECDDDEQIVRKLQTVGMLHSGNRFQLLTLDAPKGYICRIKRFAFQKVASHINNPPLAYVLKDILRAKVIIKQTLALVQEKKFNLDNLDDFDDDGREINRSERCTTPPTITLNKTHKTPKKNRTIDVIKRDN